MPFDPPAFFKSIGWTQLDIHRRSGVHPSAINRWFRAHRPLSKLAAIQIEEALRQAYARREIDVRPPTREDLCPHFTRKVAA